MSSLALPLPPPPFKSPVFMADRPRAASDARAAQDRPTLPPVRDLFRDELALSPRPPGSTTPPWNDPQAQQQQQQYGQRPQGLAVPAYAHPALSPSGQHLAGPGLQYPPSGMHPHALPSHAPHPHDPAAAQYAASATAPMNYYSLPGTHSAGQRMDDYYAQQQRQHPQRPEISRGHSSGYYAAQPPGVAGPSPPVPYVYPNPGSHSRNTSQDTSTSSEGIQSLRYECEYCGKGFSRPSSLRIHLNSHTGERPFVCTFEGCGRSFSVLSNMRRHARVHTQAAGQREGDSDDSDGQSRGATP
ncbi:hypothetical protein CONPUDRAFT_164140 [Coniophora puteana RWD-64-598 SS2]|uniref:C2H2-type domain-containing protein n=1 Tax=Coniophora puteana (strain RWD-64-598) TaxID=741705 RepID=A0A5M3MVI2_CONPW|nr:uncharacterized protein CONPUDRAFT_164140 [Coniophora puteana RWD-64-598 SS2]EIW83143.1 hypothetical protein CONPUDRAFT_164140 [Coniophora puteana RWD-64-598 SS2]